VGSAYANFLYTSTVDLTFRLYPLLDGLLENAPKLVWREIERLRKERERHDIRATNKHVDNLEGLPGFNPAESPGVISSPDEILSRKEEIEEEISLKKNHRNSVRLAIDAAIKKNPKRRKYLDLLANGLTSKEAAEKAGLSERTGRRIKEDFKKRLLNQKSKRKHPLKKPPQTISLLKKSVRFSHPAVL